MMVLIKINEANKLLQSIYIIISNYKKIVIIIIYIAMNNTRNRYIFKGEHETKTIRYMTVLQHTKYS